MDITADSHFTFAAHQHKRTTSSVLKSLMVSRNYQRNQPTDLHNDRYKGGDILSTGTESGGIPTLQPNVSPSKQQLRDESRNKENLPSSLRKPVEVYEDKTKNLGAHKKTKSSVSLKSLMGNEKGSAAKNKSPKKEETTKPKKSKSSTSLSTLLSRPKSSKELQSGLILHQKDKENQTPPKAVDIAPPPIWAQFATQPIQESTSSRKVPLNDLHDVDGEMAKYTPRDYSPSKQRNFHDFQKPALARKAEPKPRPKSAFISSGTSKASFAETLSSLRKSVDGSRNSELSSQDSHPRTSEDNGKPLSKAEYSSRPSSKENRKVSNGSSKSVITMGKRGSRVMAVVAAFNGKTKEPAKEPVKELPVTPIDVKGIENAFESLLDARNVPQQTRDKMRALDTNIKADFIKQDKSGSGSIVNVDIQSRPASPSKRPFATRRSRTDDGTVACTEEPEVIDCNDSGKVRGRSRTATFTRGDLSPLKKQKQERPASRGRPKSSDLTPSSSSKSLTSVGAVQALSFLAKAPKPAVPDEFISYLRKVQKPESVEVGKLHKLRQLLRNETISWVDAFITRGGMTEVVELLYRIMKVEWREEHEDTLLHETLLCLKALCTATLARQQLSDIQGTLFPSLLAMLFDEEKKGPSEFTTRSIIISLLFTYLSESPASEFCGRAQTLLSYLRDQSLPEAAQPPGFIASMHQPRPYRVWCKEIVNVTKEVFWIFLHHMNIIPYAPPSDPSTANYKDSHFPRERPPVPVAPYVGGVEWEATNYLASHLDLLNGIIASLPSSHERNQLRQELKDSGLEKCLGGSLRTCKEKFYGSVHIGLTTWVAAAKEDGWDVAFVREGPKREEIVRLSPKKQKKKDSAPKLEMPLLELTGGGGGGGNESGKGDGGGWL